MESLSADLIDERLRLFVCKRMGTGTDSSVPFSFTPSVLWSDTGYLLDNFADEFEPQISMTDTGVWSVQINGSSTVYGKNLSYAIARAFANSVLSGELRADQSHVPNAKSNRRDVSVSRSGATSNASTGDEGRPHSLGRSDGELGDS